MFERPRFSWQGIAEGMAACAVLIGLTGCQSEPSRANAGLGRGSLPDSPPISAQLPAHAELDAAYPPGRWRLAPQTELAKTRLWLSHILIRHNAVPANLVSFSGAGWASLPDPPTRSPREAFQLATAVAERARQSPGDFAQIAKELSEDITTTDTGGSLGGIDAYQMLSWPEILDTVSALGYGDISKPVETAYGFHILLRHAPPPSGSLSGSRIIIGHDAAPWLHAVLARRPVPHRSRAEALALAQSVYQRALDDPASFEGLVQTYSDHIDAARAGDFGEWSTTRQTPFPRSVDRLTQLEVGEVAPPLDGPFGFEIIRRDANRPRVTYAMERIQLAVRGSDPEQATLEQLRGVADELQRHPERFEEYQRRYCCLGTESWQEGQGSALHEQVLARLQMGQIARAPSRYEGGGYVILERVQPGASSQENVRFELPAPAEPNVDTFVANTSDKEMRALGQAVVNAMGVTGELGEALLRAHGERGFDAVRSAEQRRKLFLDLQTHVQGLLGASDYARYLSSFQREVEQAVLRGPRARLGRLAAPRVL